MVTIKNIGDEPFAIAWCPLLQKWETAEVSLYTANMVKFNPNIEIISDTLRWIDPEPDTKTNKSKALKGVE